MGSQRKYINRKLGFSGGIELIEELLDKYHVDDYDKLLIDIINHMIERKEIIYAEEQEL